MDFKVQYSVGVGWDGGNARGGREGQRGGGVRGVGGGREGRAEGRWSEGCGGREGGKGRGAVE